MIIDLHVHSYYSADGRLSIPELLEFYSSGDIVGLTDHETIGGWEEFKETALKRGIKPILGVEWFLRNCCHIISYFINQIPKEFIDFMTDRRLKEKHCMNLIYNKVKEKYPSILPYEEILQSKIHPENILGISALANHISIISGMSFKDAVIMLRNLRRDLPENDKPMTFSPEDIIKIIRNWNAISILAHPYKNAYEKQGRQNKIEVEKKIRELSSKGIQGIELFSDESNMEELEHLLSLSNEFGFVVSIGSDYHNEEKGLNPAELTKLDDSVKKEVKKWILF